MNLGRIKRATNVFGNLLYARMFRKRMPVKVALQVTKYCNMRCSYCYANFEAYEHMKELTKNEIFELIDELYNYGMRWLWFLGGEPMMRDDFGEIIDYATGKGIFCDMNSNGVLINEKNIHIVKKLDAVCISLDGDEESNDYYRGKGSYQKAIKAVKLLRENDTSVRLHSMLTKKTYKTLDHMVKLSKELDVTFNYCEVLKNESDPGDHMLTEEESEEFYRKYIEYKKRGIPIIQSLKTIDYMRNWPKKGSYLIYKNEASKYPRDSYVPCRFGDLYCFLDIDGRLYACNRTWEDGLNMHEVGFKKAWDYLANRKCVACNCIGAMELDRLLGLSKEAVLNSLNTILSLGK